MNNNQAKRDIMFQIVRQRTMSFGGQPVNRSHCPSLKRSDELQHLMKHGLVRRKTKYDSRHTTHTYVYVPEVSTDYLKRVRCPLCNNELYYWFDMTGPRHAKACMLFLR